MTPTLLALLAPLVPLAVLLSGCVPSALRDDSGSTSTLPDGGGSSNSAGQHTAVMTTVSMDYATGSLATVDLDSWAVDDSLTTVAGDAGLTVDDGLVIQLNRYGYDTVRLYTPGQWDAPDLELGVGDAQGSTNPHDAAICQGRLFVTLYERDYIAIYDPTGGTLTGTVDLSAYDDADSSGPEPSGIVQRGDKLYVALERLDRDQGWVDAGGKVVEVDCSSGSATRAWDIGGNTRVFDWPDHDQILVGARAFGGMAGGIYALDPAADSVTLLADVEAGGESLYDVAAYGDGAIITTLSSDLSTYGIDCVDLGTGTITQLDQRTEFLQGIAGNDRGQAWIAASWGWTDPKSASPGVFVYDIPGCTSLTGDSPIALSLAPASIAFY
ncbi:MAG: SMP-30/gluconolactonase/LRE family protein [Oligoflexia bacterium]|nr:SMP-30/gluconolactonase/LRE family protein [Oligoflexia bacterium]